MEHAHANKSLKWLPAATESHGNQRPLQVELKPCPAACAALMAACTALMAACAALMADRAALMVAYAVARSLGCMYTLRAG